MVYVRGACKQDAKWRDEINNPATAVLGLHSQVTRQQGMAQANVLSAATSFWMQQHRSNIAATGPYSRTQQQPKPAKTLNRSGLYPGSQRERERTNVRRW